MVSFVFVAHTPSGLLAFGLTLVGSCFQLCFNQFDHFDNLIIDVCLLRINTVAKSSMSSSPWPCMENKIILSVSTIKQVYVSVS